jgi:tritrans,polycis-undecaprenyl-diphosphate synthase [geranylgeranyl-diphosphate specific]
VISIRKVPEHIGIIPDGNRRLAKRLMKRPWKGHEWGVKKIRDVLEWCKELGVKVVTIYILSLENLNKRPRSELNFLFSLARKELKDILENKKHIIHKNGVRTRFFGRVELLPKDIRNLIKRISKLTENYSNFSLNLAMAYGGRQEITEAGKRIALDVKRGKLSIRNINEDVFRSYLYTNGLKDPDLIIRTGGEKRLSNFLPYQSVYSELIFLDSFWPELRKEEFFSAVREFQERKRRFGR